MFRPDILLSAPSIALLGKVLLKDDDVPTYVAHGGADLGVVGSDRVAESGEDVFSPLELPFGQCRLSLIGRAGEEFRPNGQPVRVGTKDHWRILRPTTAWQSMESPLPKGQFEVATDLYYVNVARALVPALPAPAPR